MVIKDDAPCTTELAPPVRRRRGRPRGGLYADQRQDQPGFTRETTKVVELDRIECLLNPAQAADLAMILEMTAPSRRYAVAVAFAGTTLPAIAARAGLGRLDVMRWTGALYKMPLGGGIRLARLFGVPAQLLFEHQIMTAETRGRFGGGDA